MPASNPIDSSSKASPPENTSSSTNGTLAQSSPTFLDQPLANWIAIGTMVAILAFFIYALVRKRRKRRLEFQEPELRRKPSLEAKDRLESFPPPESLEKAKTPVARRKDRVEPPLAETELEAAARQAEEAAAFARLEAKRLLEKSRELGDSASAQQAEKAKVEAQLARDQALSLKESVEQEKLKRRAEEEERKKEEYRTRKALESEEKERRRQETEQKRIQEQEQAHQKQLEEEETQQRAKQEEQKRAAAQAGKTLSEGLARTRGGFIAGLNSFLGRNKVLDESVLAELEEVLFSADIGVRTATGLLEFARDQVCAKDLSDSKKLQQAIRDQILQIVSAPQSAARSNSHQPFVRMVVGVNGSGKTTTIGKMAAILSAEGNKVLLAAGDTFRAAAAEQLEIWGKRADTPVVRGKEGSDPGAVVYDAVKRACSDNYDILIIDTAGRLHTKAPLMEELKRVKRVIDKALPGAPHEVLLVLDSTNGQNAIAQAREFHSALQIDGIVLTKLDGTAKGGVIIGICDELKVPVQFVGIGEAVGDLRPFQPQEFVQALFE